MRAALAILLLLPLMLWSQPPTDRYKAEIFDISETNDVLFSSGVPQPEPGGGFYEFITGLPLNVDEYDTSPVDLYMDIFQPIGDTLSQRPLVIICFGGGFLTGSRDYWSIRLLCQELAKRGFVTASIDYRLGMNIFDEDLSKRAVYRGVQDARAAVRFFRADAAGANIYGVDPSKIFLGGHSAGAFMATHNAYLDKELERPPSTYSWIQDGNAVPDQGCLDCAGSYQAFDGHADAIFSLAGAVGSTSYIESSDDPTLVMFHSEDDGTVPYTSGEPFGSLLLLVIGDDLPTAYGSEPISERADSIGLPYEFYSYTNRGHGVHENGNSALYDDIVPGISDWFCRRELMPTPGTIIGDTISCIPSDGVAYHYPSEASTYYYDWIASGGVLTPTSGYDSTATVTWDAAAGQGSLAMVPYSIWDAAGDTLWLTVTLQSSTTNTYVGSSSVWHDATSWSAGRIPQACDDVVIPSSVSPVILTVPTQTEVNSLLLGQGHSLLVPSTSSFTIYQKAANASLSALLLDGQLNNDGALILGQRSQQLHLQLREGNLINTGTIEAYRQ